MKLDSRKLLGFRLMTTSRTQVTGAKIGNVKPGQVMGAKIGGGKDPTCSIVASVDTQ